MISTEALAQATIHHAPKPSPPPEVDTLDLASVIIQTTEASGHTGWVVADVPFAMEQVDILLGQPSVTRILITRKAPPK